MLKPRRFPVPPGGSLSAALSHNGAAEKQVHFIRIFFSVKKNILRVGEERDEIRQAVPVRRRT
jgi:hypothetical protein